MAKIEITPTSLVVQIEGFDRFLALISGLSGEVLPRSPPPPWSPPPPSRTGWSP